MSGPCTERSGQENAEVCNIIRVQAESFQDKCPYPHMSGKQCRVARVAGVVMELVERGVIPENRIGEATRIAMNTIPRVVDRNHELV